MDAVTGTIQRVIVMKLSEFPLMVSDLGLFIAKPGTRDTPDYSKPCGRLYEWAHSLRALGIDDFGDWNIRDLCQGAACPGTVVATIRGPRGTVEAWNNHEVFFIPKGVKPSKEPDFKEIDKANGIVFWPCPSMLDECDFVMHGKYGRYEKDGVPAAKYMRSKFICAIAEACDLAGIMKQERLPL